MRHGVLEGDRRAQHLAQAGFPRRPQRRAFIGCQVAHPPAVRARRRAPTRPVATGPTAKVGRRSLGLGYSGGVATAVDSGWGGLVRSRRGSRWCCCTASGRTPRDGCPWCRR